MSFVAVAIVFATPLLLQSDSARIVDGRVVVEPLGVSVAVPPEWLVPGLAGGCRRTTANVLTSTNALSQLGPAGGFSNQHFAAFLDSVRLQGKLVAHIAKGEWSGESCNWPLVRIYVTQESEDSIHVKARTPRTAGLRGFVPPPLMRSSISSRDSAGWRMSRVEWSDSRSDAVYNFHVDVISRTLKGKTLLFLLMSVGTRWDSEMWGIFRSTTPQF